MRYLIGLVVAVLALVTYFTQREYNDVTGENQHVALTRKEEIALGLQAAPEMQSQYGGLHPDKEMSSMVKDVGNYIVRKSSAGRTDYKFDFHLLADEQTVNAFALPGGQIFITAGLLRKLNSEGMLAGVLGHEIAHVAARHSAEQIAKQQLMQGLSGAAAVAAYDPENPASMGTAQFAALIAGLVSLKYGREDELESDRLGVKFMAEAGYNPEAMKEVMRVLAEASQGEAPPEFFSTHPNPDNRISQIDAAIKEIYPRGVPEDLKE